MPFFKNLRRRSKAAFTLTPSAASLNRNDDVFPDKLSSNLDSPTASLHSSPISFLKSNSIDLPSPHLPILPKLNTNGYATQVAPPQRPVPIGSPSTLRGSTTNGSLLSPTNSGRGPAPAPLYAPRVFSISDNSWVHQKILLIYGQIGDGRQHSMDGNLTVCHPQDSFPPTTWPVYESHFKALVHLAPGPNKLRLEFTPSRIQNPMSHSSWVNINYLPLINSPPLQLAIVLGSDSDGHFDVPERVAREGNSLDTAIRKFRMAAYLWQSFTGEQMYRNKFGRRCFRFEEEWQAGTLSLRDAKSDQMRNEARIHIIRCDRTVDELRKLGVVQQDGTTSDRGELFNVVLEAVKRYFGPQGGQTQYVSALLLDTHWDKGTQTITGHVAAASVEDHIKLALFGSYALQSYPAAMEEVVAAFTDCTRTDINFVANYGNKCGSNWEAANSGIGGHLREIGRLFGCHYQDSGIMCDDSVPLNRSFTIREPYSTRTKAQGLRLCLEEDECTWHRLDTLRFRFHPCFRLPRDSPLCSDDSIQVWSVDNGKVLVTSAAGIAFIEIYVDDDDLCRSYIEYVDGDSGNNGIPKQIDFTEGEIRQHITESIKKIRKIKLVIYSGGLSTHTVDDVSKLNSKYSTAKLPNGQVGYRGNKLGQSQSPNGLPEQLILECTFIQSKLLISVKVYHNGLIYGLEFCYEDSTSQVFGNRDPQATCSEFVFDTRRGEILMGFYVKTSQEIDGIGIITNLSRRSAVFGNSNARAGHTLIPPRGYSIAGISGSVASCIEEISLIITR
ncbi:zinc metalloproteinase [Histoplasma ohiense]|nr:zinc metalloproteinase [Histoplasma ohiense (nom. inval.)]